MAAETKTLWEQFLEKLKELESDFDNEIRFVSDEALRVKIFEQCGFTKPIDQGKLLTAWKNASGANLFYSLFSLPSIRFYSILFYSSIRLIFDLFICTHILWADN